MVSEKPLSFNGMQQLQCFNVSIIDDSDVEGTETFNISVVHGRALSVSTNQILIDPNTAVLYILDGVSGEFYIVYNTSNDSEAALALFPHLHPAFRRLQYGIAGTKSDTQAWERG